VISETREELFVESDAAGRFAKLLEMLLATIKARSKATRNMYFYAS